MRLCDAAVALPGGPGTASEVAFCLVLGRPVVLVGDWAADYDLAPPTRAAALLSFRRAVHDRVLDEIGANQANPPWRQGIDDAYAALGEPDVGLPRVEHHALPDGPRAADEVVDRVLHLLDP